MATELVVAIISAGVALVAAGITIWGQTRSTRLAAQLRREEEEEKQRQASLRLLSRYREPLIHAAFDLQSRIYNILELDIVTRHFNSGTNETRSYVLNNTTYLIAQYFGWSEILRQDGLFLDLGEIEKTHRLNTIQDQIGHTWLRDDHDDALRIFKGIQRVLGEEVTVQSEMGNVCATYGAFLHLLEQEDKPFLKQLQQQVAAMLGNPEASRSRLIQLQHAFIDLIDFLDPRFIRFPKERRSRLDP
ncbi:MAG: hypothetical protein AAF564_12065 [Bacteroidota bacterium]